MIDTFTLERILRAYEAADISTSRTMELINQLSAGRTQWHLERVWETLD